MRFYDAHLHLPTPDAAGVDALLRFLESEPGLLGGNLILNTAEEVAVAESNLHRLPPTVALIPYFEPEIRHSEPLCRSGWCKIHPIIQELEAEAIPNFIPSLRETNPRGIIVHCFPWGTELRFNTSLVLVMELARNLPDSIILATHAGGYESWMFRAHAGGLRNVHFDFSLTLEYYEGADLLRPLQRYLRFSQDRIHFGSDWPSGNVKRQLDEMIRLAEEAGMGREELETLLLDNAQCFGVISST